MKKILFRADGNSETGLGHLYRLFALLEMVKETRQYVFLTRENSNLNVIPKEYNVSKIPEAIQLEEEPSWLLENYPYDQYLIVLDGYQFNSTYQKTLKELAYQLVYIDDLVSEQMYADVVVNHSLAVKQSDYSAKTHTKFALGAKYAILRPKFIEAAKSNRLIKEVDVAFVCFGGADKDDLTYRAVQALVSIKNFKQINVVLGGAYKHKSIFSLAETHSNVSVYQNLSEQDLIQVMQKCNFAIAPASNILYEICAVKMPILSGYYVENQKSIYEGSLEKKIIYGGGNFENYTVVDFKEAVLKILAEQNYSNYTSAQAKLFDAEIKSRFLELFSFITYRKAELDDMMLVYEWANDKVSRANSYFSEPISVETHKNWFEKKLKDKNSIIYLAEVNGKPAGMVRYEIGDEHSVVGVLVDKDYRGKGLASTFLRDTAKLYFNESKKPVLAYIKQINLASIRSFEKVNYKLFKEEVVHGTESFVYKLETTDLE